MDRRQIAGALSGIGCTGGFAVAIAGLTNRIPSLFLVAALLFIGGLIGYLNLLVSVPRSRFARQIPLVLDDQATAIVPSPLKLEVGESGDLVQTSSASLYGIRRTFMLRVANTDSSRTIRGCRLQIMEVSPPTDYAAPWLLADAFDLPAGDYRLVQLAIYGEAREPEIFNSADSFVQVSVVKSRLTLDIDHPTKMTIRATGDDAAYFDFRCTLWIDEQGRFRVRVE